MSALACVTVCLCLVLQLVAGKSLDLHYGYQEIDDSFPISQTSVEVKTLEFDRLSDQGAEEICKNFKTIIHIKNPETYINCMEPIADRSRGVVLVKRDADTLEGSGDPDETNTPTISEKIELDVAPNPSETLDIKQETPEIQNTAEITKETPETKQETPEIKQETPEIKLETPETKQETPEIKQETPEIKQETPETKQETPEIKQETPEIKQETSEIKEETSEIKEEGLLKSQLGHEDPIETSSANAEIPSENPGSFKGGFDNILKGTRVQNNTLEDMESPPAILNSASTNDQTNSNGEEAKTGESQEKPTAASPNNMLLIVIGALGVIGALAFVYNFIRSKKESREIDDAIKLETEGKELKEMKPLMKSPLAQNGSKSMEYIDADPQIQVQTETRVEVN